MGLPTTSHRLTLILSLLVYSTVVHSAAIKGLEEGTQVAYCKQIDYVGGSQTLTASGLNCVLTSTAGSGGGDFASDGSVPMSGDLNLNGNNLDNGGVIFLIEQAEADADVAGSGQIWVNTAIPNELWFTDDAGTDVQLGVGGAFDSTAVDATTWSDGANASNIWTFDVSGTDHTLTAGNGLMTFSHAVTVTGALTGTLTGNADTVTTITGLAPDTATTAAAQANITSVGTLTNLDVDNININLNTISSTAGTDLLVTPLAGQQLILDGTLIIDAGVMTGATSITSTAFIGALTGNADTVTTNANLTGPITSIGNATSIAAQTGTGTTFVMNTSPTLVTPVLGVATATSINKVTITTPATSATLTIADGKTLTIPNTVTIGTTLTDTKYCTYSTSGAVINCNSTPEGSGDFLADGSVPMTGDINLDGNNIDNGGVIYLKEQADADADVAGSGQVWVNTATPNELYFTDDAGTDFQLGTGGSGGTGVQELFVQSAKLTGTFITAGAGIDAGDPEWRGLFDDSATETMLWHFRMPTGYSSGLTAKIAYSMAGANTTKKVDWEIDVMAVADGENITTASFDTTNEVTGGTTVPATADLLDTISITLTNADSVAVGEQVFIRINRDHDDADDDAVGDAQLHSLTIEWTE
jgi:hypothetical protein